MKKLVKILVVVVLVAIVGIVAALFYVDRLVKAGIEHGGTYALGVDTRLGSASVGLFSGQASISGLRVANPQGYETPHFLSLDQGAVAVSLGSLRQEVIEVPSFELSGVSVNLEKKQGKANYQVILENLGRFESTQKPGEQPKEAGSRRFIVRRITVKDINVTADVLPIGGKLTRMQVHIPEIQLKDIGSQDGKGVVMGQLTNVLMKAILSAIANKADSLPGDIAGELGKGLQSLAKLDVGLEVVGNVTQNLVDVTGKVTEQLGAVGKQVGDAGKQITEGVGGVLEGAGKGIGNLLPGGGEKKE